MNNGALTISGAAGACGVDPLGLGVPFLCDFGVAAAVGVCTAGDGSGARRGCSGERWVTACAAVLLAAVGLGDLVAVVSDAVDPPSTSGVPARDSSSSAPAGSSTCGWCQSQLQYKKIFSFFSVCV